MPVRVRAVPRPKARFPPAGQEASWGDVRLLQELDLEATALQSLTW